MANTIPNNCIASFQHKKYAHFIGLVVGIFYLALYQYNITISVWASLPLFLMGIPHGAIETQEKISHVPGLHYTFLYLIFGILVFCSWLISPHYTLALFLILSAFHFGQSEKHYPLIGLWVVSGSMLFYPTETLGIFSYLTGEELNARSLLMVGRLVAVTVVTILIIQISTRRKEKIRALILIALIALLPPVSAVAVYFFIFHSLGEMAKTADQHNRMPMQILKLYTPAGIPALIGGVIGLYFFSGNLISLFVLSGLAVSFIVPHMCPVEKLTKNLV
ncbi:Brp/Blh family beta-carotene 15,15'-dioxygenase [Hellea sp.]|nr:Brp/Blh family beta-carotene 15,15'-dioxygenase [Hellea sp.]